MYNDAFRIVCLMALAGSIPANVYIAKKGGGMYGKRARVIQTISTIIEGMENV